MTALADKFFVVLVDASLKATVLLALAALGAALSRRASASFRHLLWALALGCALCLPLLSQALPHWRVAVRTPVIQPRQAAVKASPAPSARPSGTTEKAASIPASSAAPARSAGLSEPAHPIQAPSTPPQSVPAHSAEHGGIPWTALTLLAWATGALMVLVRIGRGALSLRAVAASSSRVEEGSVANVMAAAAAAMRVNRPVALLVSSDAARVPVPLTWGAFCPMVALPADAWPEDRLRAALLHEMAHVRRWDWHLQTLAHLACALYWFNPLLWLAARRMRAESETACDDLVLAAGVPAKEYARHLLDVALRVRDRRVCAVAVAMAQSLRIEGRLRTVLAAGVRRGSVGRRVTASALAAVLLLALPLAALRVGAHVPLVAVPAADRLQLKGDFTLTYAVTIRNQQTTAMLFHEYQQLHRDYDRELTKDPHFQPVPEEYYMPFAAYKQRRTQTRHVVITVSSRADSLLYRTVENGDTYAQVYDGHNTQAFGNGHSGPIAPGPHLLMEECPLPAVGLPYIPLLKNATLVASAGTLQTWQAAIADVGVSQARNQAFYMDGPVHAAMDGGTWKLLDTDNSEQRWQFLQHQRFLGLWVASRMRLIKYDTDAPLPPTGRFPTLQAAMDWFRAVRKPTEVSEYRLLSASRTPFDPSTLVKPPSLIRAGSFQNMEDIYLQEALHLRYHLQDWAKGHVTLLQRMADAPPRDATAVARVDQSLRALPFPLWAGDTRPGHVWDGDPRVGHDGQKPWLTAERPSPQKAAAIHDFEIARSRNAGPSHVVLWASGRITRNTAQGTDGAEDQQEIVPAFFGGDGTSNMAADTPESDTASPSGEPQLRPAYGFRRFVSAPLPDGTRFTFLYPSYYTAVHQELPVGTNTLALVHLDCVGSRPVPWAARRGQTPISYSLHGQGGTSWPAPHEEFVSVVVGRAGDVPFPVGSTALRTDTRWAGPNSYHHAFSITDRRTRYRFLVIHEDRYIPTLFKATDPVITSSFRILSPGTPAP